MKLTKEQKEKVKVFAKKLVEKKSLKEGFMGLGDTGDSDMAFDFWINLAKGMNKLMKVHSIKEKANEFNTPGYINCALILRDLSRSKLYIDSDTFSVIPLLKKLFEKDEKNWKDSDIYNDYKKLKQFIDKL